MCDQVSDAILDAHLRQDAFSHVSCQTAAKTGMILVCGDIISKAHVNFQKVIRSTIQQIGYDKSAKGQCTVIMPLDNVQVNYSGAFAAIFFFLQLRKIISLFSVVQVIVAKISCD